MYLRRFFQDSIYSRSDAERRDRHINIQSEGNNIDRKSTRLNSSHANISYAVFCLKKTMLLSFTRPYLFFVSLLPLLFSIPILLFGIFLFLIPGLIPNPVITDVSL